MVTHRGGCHCGQVQFEVVAPAELEVHDCNCSICRKVGYLHLLVSQSQFKLLQGGDHLTTYTFNTGTAQHYFCKFCGVKSFYVPRSHPEGYSVNARCIDSATIAHLQIHPFNGAEWESHVSQLQPLAEHGS